MSSSSTVSRPGLLSCSQLDDYDEVATTVPSLSKTKRKNIRNRQKAAAAAEAAEDAPSDEAVQNFYPAMLVTLLSEVDALKTSHAAMQERMEHMELMHGQATKEIAVLEGQRHRQQVELETICRKMEAKDLGFSELLQRLEQIVTQERIDGERSLLVRIAKMEDQVVALSSLEGPGRKMVSELWNAINGSRDAAIDIEELLPVRRPLPTLTSLQCSDCGVQYDGYTGEHLGMTKAYKCIECYYTDCEYMGLLDDY